MDKMRFLKVLSIKMGVFMDKIEFFPIDAGSRGGAGAAKGSAAPGTARTRAGAAREAEREAGKAAGAAREAGTGGTETGGTETGVGRGLADYQHVPV